MKNKFLNRPASKKINLMQITHDLDYGGLQQVVVNICKYINRNIFNISVLCLRNLGAYYDEVRKLGINIHYLPQKKSGVDYLSFLKVARVLKNERIEIIHTHNTQPFIDGTIGALLSGVKTIVHTDHARQFPDKHRYMFAEWCMSHFAYKIVGVSNNTKENLIKFEHIRSNKLLTIPNGIDPSKYELSINKEKKRREIGIPSKGPVIGLGVRIVEQKGIIYLLEALPIVLDRFPDLSVVIAGNGRLVEFLKKKATDLNIENHVFFIGSRIDMHEIIKIFDIYVLPSLWEGLPMVLLEAMAAHCPIIATNVGGNKEAIDNNSGILVAPKDSIALADAISTLLIKPIMGDHLSRNAYLKFKKMFSADIMTRSYENLYLRLL